MRKYGLQLVLLVVVALGHSAVAQASMRCSKGIVSIGETTFEVLQKCGEPGSREKLTPAIRDDGQVVNGAATVENWVYGPSGGMYRFLKFIDGSLVSIESRRI